MPRINQSWREQAKPVLTGNVERFRSVWEAATAMSEQYHCKHETAKKEIRKAIRTGCTRYDRTWRWEESE